jgi:Uma2 family endonuclease
VADFPKGNQSGMSEAGFFAWLQGEEVRHEFVDGQPAMMTGRSFAHDLIRGNVLMSLRPQLRGTRCLPFMAVIAVRTYNGNIRYPDVVVACNVADQQACIAENPILVVEVLSRSTRMFDENGKLEEYKRIPGLDHILHVDPDVARVRLFTRDAATGWDSELIAGLDRTVDLGAIGLSVRLSDIYENVAFTPRPRLVTPGTPLGARTE